MSGHLGPGKCKQRVLQSFYWPGVFADVTRHCRSCDLFPFLVRLNGPTISIAILLNGSLMIGVFTIGTLTLSLFDVL
jgi:hypothetical protein